MKRYFYLYYLFKEAILGGFDGCGIFPFSVERVLAKLPDKNKDVESEIQQQLLDKLHSMRYDKVTPARADRPKKSNKLPPGAAYTATPGVGVVDINDTQVIFPIPVRYPRYCMFFLDFCHIFVTVRKMPCINDKIKISSYK